VWEILHLVDYLITRTDVDPERIGITGLERADDVRSGVLRFIAGFYSWVKGQQILISVRIGVGSIAHFEGVRRQTSSEAV
jgi:hypothetical protein